MAKMITIISLVLVYAAVVWSSIERGVHLWWVTYSGFCTTATAAAIHEISLLTLKVS